MNLDEMFAEEVEDNKNKCKGLFFKAEVSQFFNKRGDIVRTQRLVLMKRKSYQCSGCSWMLDDIKEDFSYNSDDYEDGHIIIPELKNNKTYSCRVINESRDIEYGVVEDYDIEFYEIPEKELK